MEEEEIQHVFFNCRFSVQLWNQIYSWLGINFNHFEDGWQHFILFGKLAKGKYQVKFRHLIWLATTWSIWRLRNNSV
jgi:hypothetical protein